MTALTMVWIALPFLIGFSVYLLPQLDRLLTLGVTLVSVAYAATLFMQGTPLNIQLLDSFGVSLLADNLSAWFILTNALVTAAVTLYCWQTGKTAFFYMQMIILHGSINATFICADFISLYVALEVIGIAAFLLIAYPKPQSFGVPAASYRTLWVALRYLFVSNTAMLFYLVGAILIYQTHESFAFTGLRGAPPEALALILVGLLTKGGIFISGLWLPLTHSQAESPVSAMLSGVVVKAGVFALVRFALLIEELAPLIRVFGVAAALLGVAYALVETDTKRVLACSTLSQLGWVMAVPEVAGFYALAHGLAKAALFLSVGNLPSRDLRVLRQRPIATSLWLPITLGGLSMAGCPGLVGFAAKFSTLKAAFPWQAMALNIAATGTAILYAKFIFLPHQREGHQGAAVTNPGLWIALGLLMGGLLVANGAYLEAYTWANGVKVLAIIAGGCLIHAGLIQRFSWRQTAPIAWPFPQGLEAFEHLIGVMSLMLIALFWMGWSWLGI